MPPTCITSAASNFSSLDCITSKFIYRTNCACAFLCRSYASFRPKVAKPPAPISTCSARSSSVHLKCEQSRRKETDSRAIIWCDQSASNPKRRPKFGDRVWPFSNDYLLRQRGIGTESCVGARVIDEGSAKRSLSRKGGGRSQRRVAAVHKR